jgi:DNA-binding LytR/AlgR family response regulator
VTAPLRVLVVDDEPHARARLVRLLAKLADVAVAGEADNGRTALDLIARLAPDVVLLDIEMPGLDGLAVGEAAAEVCAGGRAPAVVFTTAHSRFALDAFELDADDYLLKPVVAERLARALAKARRRLGPAPPAAADGGAAATAPPIDPRRPRPATDPGGPERPRPADPGDPGGVERSRPADPDDAGGPGRARPPAAEPPAPLDGPGSGRDAAQIVVHDRGVTRFFDARAVTRFRAVDKYTSFAAGGDEHLTRESLSALEARLASLGFVRVHRADLVRLDAVRALEPEPGGALVHLADGQVVQVSRRFLPKLRRALGLRDR